MEQDRSWAPARRPPAELDAGPVVLRRWRDADLEELVAEIERSRDHLAPWQAWAAAADRDSIATFLLASDAAFNARTDFGYGVRLPDGRLAGGMGLHARIGRGGLEIGYWIAADRINRGYATAAAGTLTEAAFELPDIERVEIHCDEANVRSAAVPRKLGYRLDRVVEDSVDAPNEIGRSMVWVRERPRQAASRPSS